MIFNWSKSGMVWSVLLVLILSSAAISGCGAARVGVEGREAATEVLSEAEEAESERQVVGPTISVRFKPWVTSPMIGIINKRYGVGIVKELEGSKFLLLELPEWMTVDEGVKIYGRLTEVEYVEVGR